MAWEVKETLTEEELKSGLRGVTLDGMATRLTVTLASGAFLVAYALQLGADNATIGILAAIPFLTHILQIPAVYLVEQLRVRRPISVYSAFISRTSLLFVALIPFFISDDWRISAVIFLLVVKGSFGAVSQCAWSSWMRDLVPRADRGTIYAKRMSLATGLGMSAALAAGFYIDWAKVEFPAYQTYSYSLLFFVAFLAGMYNVRVIAGIPEPRMASNGTNFLQLIREPFKDENFRNLMKFIVSWNFAVNLAAPFFTVYMLKTIKLDMSAVVALTVLSQLTNIAVIRIWGRFMDRFSNKSVLKVCGPLFIICTFLWIFTLHPSRHALTVPLLIILHMLMGISTAGTVLGSSNLAIRLAPREKASAYLATSSIANSLASGVAPIVGGLFSDFFAERHLSLTLKWTSPVSEVSFQTFKLHHWDFFFFFAFLLGCFSIYLLSHVKERGDVKPGVIMQEFIYEMGRGVRSLSSAGGLVRLSQFPLAWAKNRINGNNRPA